MERAMDIKQIKSTAKSLGIDIEGMSKTEIIRSIQRAEGSTLCYGHGMFVCDNIECRWRKDCLGLCEVIRRKDKK